MTIVAWEKAVSKDLKHDRMKFEELIKILEKHYKVKSIGKNTVLLYVPNETEADIEVSFYNSTGVPYRFRVELWYFNTDGIDYDFKRHCTSGSISEAISTVDRLLDNVKMARRLKKEAKL